MEQVFILIQFLLSRPYAHICAGAVELSKIISARAERGLYLSTALLFHKRFPRLFALSFIFYKVNEIVPPPLFCQPFSFVFPRFFIFCRFCGSFSAIFAFSNKKLSTAHRLWITRFYFLCGCFIRTDYFSSGCFSITSSTSVNSVGGVMISSRTFLIREEMSCILRARLSE